MVRQLLDRPLAANTAPLRTQRSPLPILNTPDGHEEELLAELRELTEELKQIDPPAFEGYLGYLWAEFLDRWLW